MKDEGSVDGGEVDEDADGRNQGMRMTWEDVWTERGMMGEEQEVDPMDQHQHEGREDET